MRLRLYENHRFVLYAPFYAAYAIGAYSAEGLTVERSRSPGAGLAEQAPLDGAVEVFWAGPMRVMKHHDENPDSALICFAEIVCRDPLSIVDCRPNPEFRLAELTSKRFATVSEVPTPWLCLKEDFRQAGVDPEGLDCVAHSSMTENLAALRNGWIEAAQLFEPFVEEALASKTGHLWYAASSRGRTTYTAFVTTRDLLVGAPSRYCAWSGQCPDTAMDERTVRSGDRGGHRGVLPGPRSQCARARAPAARRSKCCGRDPALPEDGFDRLRRGLLSGGSIRRLTAYKSYVDNRLARQVIIE